MEQNIQSKTRGTREKDSFKENNSQWKSMVLRWWYCSNETDGSERDERSLVMNAVRRSNREWTTRGMPCSRRVTVIVINVTPTIISIVSSGSSETRRRLDLLIILSFLSVSLPVLSSVKVKVWQGSECKGICFLISYNTINAVPKECTKENQFPSSAAEKTERHVCRQSMNGLFSFILSLYSFLYSFFFSQFLSFESRRKLSKATKVQVLCTFLWLHWTPFLRSLDDMSVCMSICSWTFLVSVVKFISV